MPLPSAVTLGSLALVVAAGAGLGVVTSTAQEDRPSDTAATSGQHPDGSPTAGPGSDGPQRHGQHGKHGKHGEHGTHGKHGKHGKHGAVPTTLVDIYNNSGIPDLAAREATFLSGAGWNVAATDNWYGDIPADTVYFPPQMRHDAKKLAKALHIDRIHHAVEPMQFDRLTVILTAS
jgi:hypothetical protein